MSRVQLALNVADLDASIEFYTQAVPDPAGQGPRGLRQLRHRRPAAEARAVRRHGRARFAQPRRCRGRHRPTRSLAVIARTRSIGLEQEVQENTSCCFAVQDKTWVKGPENDWEFYTVLGDAPSMACGVDASTTGWPTDEIRRRSRNRRPAVRDRRVQRRGELAAESKPARVDSDSTSDGDWSPRRSAPAC